MIQRNILFNDYSLNDLFKSKHDSIKKEIDSYNDSVLLNMDLEKTLSNLIDRNKINRVNVFENKLTYSIKYDKQSGRALGMSQSIVNHLYDVTFVKYSLPVSGAMGLLKYKPENIQPLIDAVFPDFDGDNLTLTYIHHGVISENDDAKEKIKESLRKNVDVIKDNIEKVTKESSDFENTLYDFSKPLLEIKVSEAKRRKKDHDDLNPFST